MISTHNLWLSVSCTPQEIPQCLCNMDGDMGPRFAPVWKPPCPVIDNRDDVINWKHFPRYWPFVREIHWSPVYSTHKGQWRGAFMFSLTCARINGGVNNCGAGDLRRIRPHYDVTVMIYYSKVDNTTRWRLVFKHKLHLNSEAQSVSG